MMSMKSISKMKRAAKLLLAHPTDSYARAIGAIDFRYDKRRASPPKYQPRNLADVTNELQSLLPTSLRAESYGNELTEIESQR